MHLKRLVVVVVHVAILIATQVTRQVHAVQVLNKHIAVKEELLAEVTPWVGEDLCTTITRWVPMLDVSSQVLHVIDSLLTDENCAAFQADETKGLLMRVFHVAPQAFLVWEVILGSALVDQASQSSKLHAL